MSMDVNSDRTARRDESVAQVVVWDPLVRIGHWLLAILFFTAYFTEGEPEIVHTWAGYGIATYVVLRVVWGFLGPRRARFSDFACSPAAALRYLRDLIRFRSRRHVGHSPAGAWMIFALLTCLAATTTCGMALLAVKENAGPLAPWLGRAAALEASAPLVATARASGDEEERREEGEERGEPGKEKPGEVLEEVHDILASLTMTLVALHIAGVILASVAHRENLARSMVTGRKRAEPD